MTTVRPPGLGPIVGHTTDTTCRLWIRAGDPGDVGAALSSDRRTIGVVTLVDVDQQGNRVPIRDSWFYFRLKREYDRTGVFAMGKDVALGRHEDDGADTPGRPYKLKPDTSYRARLGSVTIDDPLPDEAIIEDKDLWRRLPPIEVMAAELCSLKDIACEATFRTYPAAATVDRQLAFLIGSCRYPGLLWKVKEADQIFGPMFDHFDPARARGVGGLARFNLMVGDQIYADKLNRAIPLGLADTYEEFQDRYVKAFGSPRMRRLLANSASYMTLDDHEIEDNWTQDRVSETEKLRVFNLAIGAYRSYQWVHGPRNHGEYLFYDFACAGYPFFVLDTRTHRFKNGRGLKDNHMLGRPSRDLENYPSQLDVLLDWLSRQQKTAGNVPKFIVSSSVFAPNEITERRDPDAGDEDEDTGARNKSDSWPAFPTTRRTLLKYILEANIQNVVFLSGDIHCSNVTEMWFQEKGRAKASGKRRDLRMYAVTSSAYYWPFPFADGDPNNYVHDSTDKAGGQYDGFPVTDKVDMHYKAFNFSQDDNFCRIDVDRGAATLRVRVFGQKGEQLFLASGTALDTTLQLASW